MGWVEAEGYRILFDPQLSGSHHQGLFRVFPERQFARELDPDLVVVSHRHPDHFDVPSLARLGKRNPILVTPDVFVGQVAERLGFSVCILRNYEPLCLDGLILLPTPSFCKVVEWGMMVHSQRGWLWNQVDTELQSAARVVEVIQRAQAILGERRAPDLAIVRWQPLHEVEPVLGGAMGFPLRDWERQLQLAVATGAENFITGSAGFAYARGRGWQDRSTFPGTEGMFARDLRALRPEAKVWEARVGAVWELDGGVREGENADWVRVEEEADPRLFLPWELPALVDPRPVSDAERRAVALWLREELYPALVRAWPGWGLGRAVRLALRLVGPEGPQDRSLRVDGEKVEEAAGIVPDYDAVVGITLSGLAAVIDGRLHWGTVLLGGELRATQRLWTVRDQALHRVPFPAIFLYEALGYEASFERMIWRQVEELLTT
jgi:hypothetical protein